jgi:hypothetical protein
MAGGGGGGGPSPTVSERQRAQQLVDHVVASGHGRFEAGGVTVSLSCGRNASRSRITDSGTLLLLLFRTIGRLDALRAAIDPRHLIVRRWSLCT